MKKVDYHMRMLRELLEWSILVKSWISCGCYVNYTVIDSVILVEFAALDWQLWKICF